MVGRVLPPELIQGHPTPPRVTGPTTTKATRPSNKLPQWLIDEARVHFKETFDAKKHLSFQPPQSVYTMKEIGLEGHGISPVAASEPFPLFTPEAIKQIRAEVFSEPVLKDCQYSSSFAKNMIRGMGRERAPFTCDAWSSPELLVMVSQVAGLDLVPMFDYEIANINSSVNDENKDGHSDGETSAFAWHYDSFAFVCVTMLSDCTDMIGGETAIRTPSGEVKKIRGPSMGTAVIMQGRYIEHQALKSIGGRERISMVTAFRPKSPAIRDEAILTGSRAISNWSELYTEYSEYRLELLEERIRAMLKKERIRKSGKRPFNISDMQHFLDEQKAFIESMMVELIEVEDVN
ncbi:hypothetical protein BO94DRAFT_59491 [Aspergillus sclerotioniger CBS 115572]|uniref:Fe2OG dioxygenase domain-containing protein n=1 Tax=Aspergillus sclerotioniger CBS 115572 TaxID=1450535 RepID=A0A317WNK6_9EURO|nr:hypothetical protein BO94DRAFT_59491 [Aspergillus sclerotioniger CBS 115572]PWY87953.1 hypothetical protein BO94DRAFT_59491 [Aspergillus sclerotioniger CBS 115572]